MAGFWRVAIASSDGKTVDLHFDNTCLFQIVDLDEDGVCRFAESRPVPPLCGSDEGRPENLLYMIDTLKDCSGVLAARVAMDVKRMMELNCIAVFEFPHDIDRALLSVSDYFSRSLPSDG